MVIVPSIESILGDKLMSFASHTIGGKSITDTKTALRKVRLLL